MGWYYCERCNGSGHVAEPNRKWWQFWKRAICPDCVGDGHARPKGPRPKAPPAPPPPPAKRIEVITRPPNPRGDL